MTNIPPDEQYPNVDKESVQAFYRRIHKVREYTATGTIREYAGVNDYLDRHKWADDDYDYAGKLV